MARVRDLLFEAWSLRTSPSPVDVIDVFNATSNGVECKSLRNRLGS